MIIGRWIGLVSGTNRGHLLIDVLKEDGDKITGSMVLLDLDYPSLTAKFSGKRDGLKIIAELSEFKPIGDGLPRSGNFSATLDQDLKEMRGAWATDAQTKGEFQAYKEQQANTTQSGPLLSGQPKSFATRTEVLPTCYLDVQGLVGLIAIAVRGTAVTSPMFSFSEQGDTAIRVGIEAFAQDPTLPDRLHDFSITMNEQWEGKGYRNVQLNFTKYQQNTVTVTGEDATWVRGKVAEIVSFLRRHQTPVNFLYRKYGTWVNSIIFFILLAALPSITTVLKRLLFVVIVFAGILLPLLAVYNRSFPSTTIFVRGTRSAPYRDLVLPVLATVLATLVVMVLSAFFTIGHWRALVEFFKS